MRVLFLLLAFISSPSFANYSNVGQRTFEFLDSARERKIFTTVWYPALDTALPTVLGGQGPFVPVVAAENSPVHPSEEQYPIVLLSHGSGGTADKLFWLADYLVRRGIIVIAVNHPGNMTGDNSGQGLIEVWKRPGDLSFALDRILESRDFRKHMDLSRVGTVGHSAGGTTALLLAGGRFSSDRFTSPVPHCRGTKDPYFSIWCEQIDKLDLKSYKKTVIEGDYHDTRVSAAVAIDPGFSKSFDPKSLKRIAKKAYVFAAEKLFSPFDEIYSKNFIQLLGPESFEIIPQSVHMSFLQGCKPALPNNDPELRELCANNDLKIKIQDTTAKKTLEFLLSRWNLNPKKEIVGPVPQSVAVR